ncbi:MAG TPA: head GIN domain-containing protein [Flavisolibacter sp.]|nr:head GIN domain-containing protein [Flavisolibacter sp.]
MKKLFSLVCLLCFFAFAQAQKVINDPNAEPRKVSSFTGIDVSGGIDIYISAGDEAVAVSASKPEYRERIKTEVENGILKIWYDSKWGISINGNKNLKAYVSYKTLKSLEASGGSDITADGTIKASELTLRVSGGADFKGAVEAGKLSVKQSGGSDVRISGKATNLTVDASGGSDFKGYELAADVCDLEASGACDIEVTANREISARASGASDIHYKGNPSVKEAKASGASSVKSRS